MVHGAFKNKDGRFSSLEGREKLIYLIEAVPGDD
jgi:hypothetical protein